MNDKTKLTKLVEKNEELENYFRNTIIPRIFVDNNLILKKFTPPAFQTQSHKVKNEPVNPAQRTIKPYAKGTF